MMYGQEVTSCPTCVRRTASRAYAQMLGPIPERASESGEVDGRHSYGVCCPPHTVRSSGVHE